MINKRSLWFLTLFSLILVLSVYYITIPSELLMMGHGITDLDKEKTKTVSKAEVKKETESTQLVALRVESEEKMLDEMNALKDVLTDSKKTTAEKNAALEKMKTLNQNRGLEEEIEKKIKKTFDLGSFVKIDDKDIVVVIDSDKHDKSIANNIMRAVQEEFKEHMSISVQFKK